MDSLPEWIVRPNNLSLSNRLLETKLSQALLLAALTGLPEQVALVYNQASPRPELILVFANPDGTISSERQGSF